MTEWTKEQQKEHRRVWVEALRSGKYKQTKGVLNNGNGGFCCLGVACDLVKDELSLTIDIYRNADNPPLGVKYNDEGMTLPPIVKNYYGLRFSDGTYAGHNRSLAYENDVIKCNFNEIADIIESEPEGLIEWVVTIMIGNTLMI